MAVNTDQNLRSIFSSLDDCIFVTDEQGSIIDINPAVSDNLGYFRDNLIGNPITHLFPVDKKDDVNRIFNRLPAENRVTSHISLITKHGSLVDFEIKVTRGHWDNQDAVFWICREETLKINNENTLQASSLRLQKIYDCLSSSGPDSLQNINRLTSVCGELLNATCALYNRLYNGLLCSIGQWEIPDGYNPVDSPEGHICYDVIKKNISNPIIINNLQSTPYAESDPNVQAYGLKTYCGLVVKSEGEALGSLCVVYQSDRSFTDEDLRIMGIIASAIGNEDKRKQVEDELQENADKYKSLFENSVLAILMGEPDGKILNANRIATELFGYSLEELRQVGRKGILDETDEHTIESLKHRKANGTITGTLKFIKKDGSTFSGQLYSAIYRDKNGREKTSIIIQDVSDKLKTEKLLKDSEELYRTLVENMPDGVYKTTHEGRFIEVNPAMATMFGYCSKEELMAVNIPETMYFSPDDREKLMMKELGGELLEYCVRKKDGSPIWVEDHGWYTRDDSGNIISHEGILRDISQKRKTLLALKESEEKYRTFISSTSDMVYLKDENHRYTIVNQAFADYFNCQPTDIIGKTDFEIMPAIAAENCLETDRIALGANTVYMSEETIGNEVFETSKFKVLLASGNYGTGGYIRNITLRKRNEKQLAEQADKLMQLNATKDKLFSVIAHDLRNPFNIILGFTDLLTENYNDFDETAIQNSIKAITIASHQAYNLLENLLLWAKAQSDRIEFTQDVVDINACIRETMVLCYNQAEAKHIGIFTDIDNKCFALADYNLTSIIVRNLITNALKFTNQKGKVWITAHNRSDSVEIAVNDNGIGMDPEVINNIIIKGNTISTTGTSNEKGSGLGLLICKEFIEKQGGRLDIKSKPGAGSTFSFTLPLP